MTHAVLAAGVLAWLASAAILLGTASSLGHDESQYAIAAQDLLEGHPTRWNYLSIGTSVLAVPGVLAGGSSVALRLLPVLIGLAFLAAAHRVARGLTNATVAAWVIAVIAASFSMSKRAADLLSDLPSTALLLAGAYVAVTEVLREGGPRRRVVLAAPLLAAAFYVRYGSALAIAVIAGVVVLVGWRGILARPLRVLATAGLGALLLVPHFVAAHVVTGSPLGVLRESSSVLGSAYFGESLVTYLTSNPFTYYGIVAAPVMVAGLCSIRRARDRRVLATWLLAVGDVIAVGLTPVPQARYIFFAMVLLMILGVDELHRWTLARPAHLRRAAIGFAAAAVAVSWVVVGISARRLAALRDRNTAPMRLAAQVVRADAAGRSCRVIGRHTTQLQWYSGCPAVPWAPEPMLAEHRTYLVREYGKREQPELDGRPGTPRLLRDDRGVVAVYRMELE